MYLRKTFLVSLSGATVYGVRPFLSLHTSIQTRFIREERRVLSLCMQTFKCHSIMLVPHLRAGSAPASISSLTVAICAAPEATCSKVDPDGSTGSFSRDRGARTIGEWLSDC